MFLWLTCPIFGPSDKKLPSLSENPRFCNLSSPYCKEHFNHKSEIVPTIKSRQPSRCWAVRQYFDFDHDCWYWDDTIRLEYKHILHKHKTKSRIQDGWGCPGNTNNISILQFEIRLEKQIWIIYGKGRTNQWMTLTMAYSGSDVQQSAKERSTVNHLSFCSFALIINLCCSDEGLYQLSKNRWAEPLRSTHP